MPSNAILRAIPPAILCALASPALAEDPAAESAPVCATADLHESGIDWLKADPDYGAYLGGECLGCHTDAGAEGVPGISGIDPDYFYNALWEYCAGTRENAAMISVARSLDEEQMIALAAWFAQRDPDGE